MKKSFKVITMSLAVFSTLSLFSPENTSAVSSSESKESVFQEPIASTKAIVINTKMRVGDIYPYNSPASRFTITGNIFAIEVEERSPNFTVMRAVSPGKVTISYRTSLGELVINNLTITY